MPETVNTFVAFRASNRAVIGPSSLIRAVSVFGKERLNTHIRNRSLHRGGIQTRYINTMDFILCDHATLLVIVISACARPVVRGIDLQYWYTHKSGLLHYADTQSRKIMYCVRWALTNTTVKIRATRFCTYTHHTCVRIDAPSYAQKSLALYDSWVDSSSCDGEYTASLPVVLQHDEFWWNRTSIIRMSPNERQTKPRNFQELTVSIAEEKRANHERGDTHIMVVADRVNLRHMHAGMWWNKLEETIK